MGEHRDPRGTAPDLRDKGYTWQTVGGSDRLTVVPWERGTGESVQLRRRNTGSLSLPSAIRSYDSGPLITTLGASSFPDQQRCAGNTA